MTRNHAARRSRSTTIAERFFEAEYRLDYAIHRSRKPVVCFGHGVVMGGGLGSVLGVAVSARDRALAHRDARSDDRIVSRRRRFVDSERTIECQRRRGSA